MMRLTPSRLLSLARFFCWFALELLRANLRVAAVVLNPARRLRPALVRVPVAVSTERALVVLADLVTLTPGTLTIEVDRDRRQLLVHAVEGADPAAVRAAIQNEYVPRVEAAFS